MKTRASEAQSVRGCHSRSNARSTVEHHESLNCTGRGYPEWKALVAISRNEYACTFLKAVSSVEHISLQSAGATHKKRPTVAGKASKWLAGIAK